VAAGGAIGYHRAVHKLVKGIHGFQRGFFASHRQLFEQLASVGQRPETLFITCSDSRIVPNLITGAPPGELFLIRNVGNVVPSPSLPGGTAAAIEYAVEVLEVENVIICGHTQCGALEAILEPERLANLGYVKRWLAQAERVRLLMNERYPDLDPAARLKVAVQENVLVQLENLREYPFVARRLEAGRLLVSGWVYDLARGEIFDYDPEAAEFLPLRLS
jgi:carbonic anhydrase